MTARINSIAPNLPANDVLKAVEWYEQKLGFSRLFIHPEESPTFGAVMRDGAEIQIFQMKIDPKKSDWMSHLRVTGIEQLYEEYSRQGVIYPNINCVIGRKCPTFAQPKGYAVNSLTARHKFNASRQVH